MTTRNYPGLGIPLRHFPQDVDVYPMGIHGNFHGAQSDLIPVREVAMMGIMDKLTDKENWHKKVLNDAIIAKWREEALEYPDDLLWKQAVGDKGKGDGIINHLHPLKQIMTNETFDYCVQELQSKARYYEKTGLIPTLDACASVVKSDRIIDPELQEELRKAFYALKKAQADSPDWHPNSESMVQDLIHPSMYPLVYGKSRVLNEEVVGVSDAIHKWAGKGQVIPIDNVGVPASGTGVGGSYPPSNFWSDTYQWLPSNVAFQPDGGVKFASYINNLHPNKYPEIYRTIEKLIEKSLPAWDQCLALSVNYDKKVGAGRLVSRFSKPRNPDDENEHNWVGRKPGSQSSESGGKGEGEDPETEIDLETEDEMEFEEEDEEAEETWRASRIPVQPEPDTFHQADDFYDRKPWHKLSAEFKDSGLQIIVKMASIELTPDKPEFPAGGWHVEGQMNERIAATALYYLDSENITPSSLSFRMQTSAYMEDEYSVGQDSYEWLEQVYGTTLGQNNSPCLQNYGSVETREGRLLAFPNIFQHRVSPFHLTDPTKPGHRRFIALWLVDPHVRIISTANVPPQQQDWWVDAIFSQSDDVKNATMSKIPGDLASILQEKGMVGEGKLPLEIAKMVREYFDIEGDTLPMTGVEAREHREALMDVRGAFHKDAEGEWQKHSYSFCEH